MIESEATVTDEELMLTVLKIQICDRQNHQTWVYRADGSVTQYPATAVLNGEDVVLGFTLPVRSLLEARSHL